MTDRGKEYPKRLTVQVTEAMEDRLEQVARGRDEAKAEVVRAALRAFLDEQEDVIGSRKHFTKAFGRRIDYLERLMSVVFAVNLDTLHMLSERLKKEAVAMEDLVVKAVNDGVNSHEVLVELIEMTVMQKTKPPA
jgi:Arc/MetJ-type ribon-helix-helix transcriptional regulator